MFENIIKAYPLNFNDFTIAPIGNGLINQTWKLTAKDGGEDYILQRVNIKVFKTPGNIAFNIRFIADYLRQKHPQYLFAAPVKTKSGDEMLPLNDSDYFRIFPFLKDSHTIDVVHSPGQAYEASRQFAMFTNLLCGVDVKTLKITLPDFHNLSLRYQQFRHAVIHGDPERIKQSAEVIEYLESQKPIVDIFEMIKTNPQFLQRVTHHDTKISNVLFDAQNKGICVIDLDTVMPGYFISDVGDMMRTYLSVASEEEADFSKINVREPFFKAIVEGYLREMKNELTGEEKSHFIYAGKFMIYMQAIRFITDHLNNDVYYGAKYEGHNLVRGQNQAVLLQKLIEKEKTLNEIVEHYLSNHTD